MGRWFFKKLFWVERPKAGMLFGMTLMTTLFFVVLPLTLYIKFIAQPTALWLFFMESRLPSIKLPLLGFVGLLMLYSLILQLLYYINLLRDVLGLRRLAAVPLGFLAAFVPGVGILGIILPGAIKMRNRKVFGAMVATILFSVALGVAEVFSAVWPLLLIFFVLAIFFWVCLIYHFPETPRVGLWGYSPIMILFVFISVVGIQDIVLDHQIDELSRDFEEQSRISLTSEEVINGIFDGVSIEDEPYSEVFSEAGMFSDLRSIKSAYDFTRPSAEEIALFEAFMVTNAVQLAKVDAITTKPDFDVAYSSSVAGRPAWFVWNPAISHYLQWTRFYLAKANFAAWRGDTATVLDSLARLDNIRTYLGVKTIDRLIAMAVDRGRFANLCHALAIIPDDSIAKLQSEIAEQTKTIDGHMRVGVKSGYFLLKDYLDLIRNGERYGSIEIPPVRLAAPLGRVWLKFESRCALKESIKFFMILNDASLTESQRYKKLTNEFDLDFYRDPNQNMRLPLCRDLSFGMASFKNFASSIDWNRAAVAGLAVERYRRCHGELPETLSDLVPEFLDAVPNSCRDGKPLDYRTGDIEQQRPKDGPVVIHGFRISARAMTASETRGAWTIPSFVAAVPVPGEDELMHPSS